MKKKIAVGLGCLALILGLSACGKIGHNNTTNSAQDKAAIQQNSTTNNLVTNQPPPSLNYSTDRAAIIKRYQRTADPNFRQYIAVLTNQGGIMYTGVVKGKVTPLDSQLTPADALDCQHHGGYIPDGCGVVQLAEPNGTWGTNGQGVFWFDDKDVMHETSMQYMISDQPFQVTTPPLLTVIGQTSVGK